MLELKNVDVYYGNIHALKGVSLKVDQGEIVTLIGSNGAGKSTTLASITGLLKPKKGEILYNHEDINGLDPGKIVYKGISLSPEGREVFPQLSVYDNLRLGAYSRKNRKEIQENFDTVFRLFPRLKERRKQVANTLSGGEQQMLAIGRSLMSNPTLLMLDEPSLGLSPNLVDLIFTLIKEINAMGTTILLVEQNAQKALVSADRAYVLETGRVVLEGSAEELIDNETVKSSYLGSYKESYSEKNY